MLIIGFAAGRIQKIPANLILVKNISVVGVVYGAQTERDPSYGASFVQEAADLFRQGRVKPHMERHFHYHRLPRLWMLYCRGLMLVK